MRYRKRLGLAAISVTALTVFLGASSVAANGVLCSTKPITGSNKCTSQWASSTVIDLSLKPKTTVRITDTANNTLSTCTFSTIQSVLVSNPDAGGTVTTRNSQITWGADATPCTTTTDTIVPGTLRIGGEDDLGNGSVYVDSKIETTMIVFGASCNYGLEVGTYMGTFKEGIGTGAMLIANAVVKKFSGSFLCPETTKLAAEYVLTSPNGTTAYVTTE